MKTAFIVFVTLIASIYLSVELSSMMSEPDTMYNIIGATGIFIVCGLLYKTRFGSRWKGLFAASATLITLGSCTRIDAGHEGIKVNLTSSSKGVDGAALVTGWQFYNPMMTSVYEFPTYVQTVDYEAFSVNAKDGSVFTVDPTLSLKVVDGHSPIIFTKYRKPLGEIINTTLYNYVRDAFRIQFNSFTTDSVISNRAKFEDAVQTMLAKSLQEEGFHLEQMTSGMVYPPTIVEAITKKNEAIQEAMKVQNQLAKAKAQAEITLTEARARAESQRILDATLTDKLIKAAFIKKWDGKLPVYGTTPTLLKEVQ